MRLIDADALMQNAEYKGKHDILTAYDVVAAPTVDAVPIVRCKDCIQSKHDEIFNHWWCDGRRVNPFHFCGYGKRKDLSLPTDNSDRCVCCGEPVPEGRMVCPSCERRAEE